MLLDDRADAAVRELWRALDEAGLPSQQRVRSDTNRPHITLIAAERISPDVDTGLAELDDLFPLPTTLGAPVVFFGGGRLTLARLVIPSEAVLALHRRIYELCQPYVWNLFSHSAPGHWTPPHVTLGRRLTPAQIGEALARAGGISSDIEAGIVGLRRWDSDARTEHVLIS